MERKITYQINQTITVNDYLSSLGYSKAILSQLKRRPNIILVNGIHQMHSYLLQPNDILDVYLYEKDENKFPVLKTNIEIIYQDQDIVVLNKASGVLSHPSKDNDTPSVLNGLCYLDNSFPYYCVNRLDKDTSGLMVFAKNKLASSILQTNKIEKKYYAIVEGKTDKKGYIDQPIKRLNEEEITRIVDPSGQKAITNYSTIKYDETNNISFIELTLQTGRTHQIRVHMQYINHPLIGDELYNPNNKQMYRQALHVHYLSFSHPINKEIMQFECEIPQDMKAILKQML